MRGLIIILLFLSVSIYLGLMVVWHPGYLLVVSKPWMVQMPLWFAALCLLILISLIYFLTTFSYRLQFVWFKLKNWLKIRREHQSFTQTQRGLAALVEGRFKKAEKLLTLNIERSPEPLTNYLSAAKAAHEQGAFERRDQYLGNALEVMPAAKTAILITKAELLIAQQHYEEACAVLMPLQREATYHPKVLTLLRQIYQHLEEPERLFALLPAIRKAKLLDADQLSALEARTAVDSLRAASSMRLSELRKLWKSLPRSLQKQPDVVYAYAVQLAKHAPITGEETANEIKQLVQGVLKHHWHPGLIKLYGTLPFNDYNRQLVMAGAWLKLYGEQPELLFLLGKFCANLQLWGRAKDYFSKCLAKRPYPEAALEYGRLLDNLGEEEQAMQIYKMAIENCPVRDL